MSEQELVVIPGEASERAALAVALRALRAVRPEVQLVDAGARVGLLDLATLARMRQARRALLGSALDSGSLAQLSEVFDLFARLYPLRDQARGINLLLLMAQPRPALAAPSAARGLSPFEAWSATRLGNLAAQLLRWGQGRVILAHDSEPAFAHAVQGGLGQGVEVERLDAIFLLNHLQSMAPQLDLLVTSAPTGALLLAPLARLVQPLERVGYLLLGPDSAIAAPAALPSSPTSDTHRLEALIRSVVALLRFAWADDAAATRLEAALDPLSDAEGASLQEVAHALLTRL